MEIGMLVSFQNGTELRREFQKAAELGLSVCQLCCWDVSLHTDARAAQIRTAARETGMRVSALWAGWDGPAEWNFQYGPATLGLVPTAYRQSRLEQLASAGRFAAALGVRDVITHVGFLPENPSDPDFVGTVGALRRLAGELRERDQRFLFETGQETPTTLLRAIEAIGLDNVGVNLDTGNLVCYGKANPVDALDVLGRYVWNTHIKDCLYPTDGQNLGKEVPFGQGKANFPALVARLAALGYPGPLIIEREIQGEQQTRDIVAARDGLRAILGALD